MLMVNQTNMKLDTKTVRQRRIRKKDSCLNLERQVDDPEFASLEPPTAPGKSKEVRK